MSKFDIPCYAFSARHTSRQLSQFYERMIAGSGIHAQQFTILAIIEHNQPLTVTELAEALEMDRTTIARSLRPIERDGNISIVSGKNDRRNRIITITAQGKERLLVAMEMWRKAQEQFESRFGVERAARLREELRAAADAVTS